MKTSLCSIAFRNEPIGIADIVRLADQVGYESVEIWGNHIVSAGQVYPLKEALEATGLSVSMISPYFDLTGSESAWRESLETAERYISFAAALESPLLRAFTGVAGSAEVTQEQRRACVAGLRRICGLASKANVGVALETHPKTLVDNVPATFSLLEEVDRPNLLVNLDIYHMFEVHGDAVGVLRELYPRVAHVHAKNARLSPQERTSVNHPLLHDRQAKQNITGVTPLADGEMPYAPFLRELELLGYHGAVSVEWFGENPLLAAQLELAYLQGVLTPAEAQLETAPAS